jgi:hypothetical protein
VGLSHGGILAGRSERCSWLFNCVSSESDDFMLHQRVTSVIDCVDCVISDLSKQDDVESTLVRILYRSFCFISFISYKACTSDYWICWKQVK